jgi:hypothetical protein
MMRPGRFAAGLLVGVCLPVMGWLGTSVAADHVQYRPVWSVQSDYLDGRTVGLGLNNDTEARDVCGRLSAGIYDHPEQGPNMAQDQIAFNYGCQDAAFGQGNRVKSFANDGNWCGLLEC